MCIFLNVKRLFLAQYSFLLLSLMFNFVKTLGTHNLQKENWYNKSN